MEYILINKKFIKRTGDILTLISFIFIINKIVKYKIDFCNIITTNFLLIIITAIIIYSFVVILYSKLYQSIIKIYTNNKFSTINIIYTYCKSNLYKYIPGNFFQYLGRNEIPITENISHKIVNIATIAEVIFQLISCLVVSFVLSGQFAINWLYSTVKINPTFLLLLAFIICLIVIILYFLRRKTKRIYEEYLVIFKQIKLTEYIKFPKAYILTFIVNGLMFLIILNSIGDKSITSHAITVIGLYSFSWMIGFITPGAPAGLGIREVLISSLLKGIVGEQIIITSVIIFRIITITGDIIAFFLVYTFRFLKGI